MWDNKSHEVVSLERFIIITEPALLFTLRKCKSHLKKIRIWKSKSKSFKYKEFWMLAVHLRFWQNQLQLKFDIKMFNVDFTFFLGSLYCLTNPNDNHLSMLSSKLWLFAPVQDNFTCSIVILCKGRVHLLSLILVCNFVTTSPP